jgi:hypothetical protein
MSGFLDGLYSEYGSGDEYLRSIGVSKDTLEVLRSSLITD